MNGGRLVRIDRGEQPDTLELIDDAGHVVMCHAHGLHDDEKFRVRELILQLVRGALTRGAG